MSIRPSVASEHLPNRKWPPLIAVLMVAALAGPSCEDEESLADVCEYEGMLYEDGEQFPAGDGCNTCSCNPNGDTPSQYACTGRLCVEPYVGVDLDPYYSACDAEAVDACPAPYECTTETSTHDPDGPQDVCLLPCTSFGQCSDLDIAYFCMGVDGDADVGADFHCIQV